MKSVGLRGDESRAGKAGVLRRLVSVPEGKFLIAGVVLVCLHAGAITLTRLHSARLSHSLLTMTGTHILGGRAAGMSWGYVHNLKAWLVIVANMSIETFLVLLFYPLFVFSYRRLIVIKPLEQTMARVQRTAKAYQPEIMKYGIPGLLVFVWFPFWMTGPLVGSVIGFLIGLRPGVNLAVVLSGTYVAILCWGLVLQRVYELLRPIGPYVPLVFVGFILLLAISVHIRYAFSSRAPGPAKDDKD